MKDLCIAKLAHFAALAVGCVAGAFSIVPAAAGASYYIDCSASASGNGTSASPWNSLTSANATTFSPGDFIYFKRGTTCYGTFAPLGSGNATHWITVSAFGAGALPVIDGQANKTAASLTDQSYWALENLKLLHGENYGLLVTASVSISGISLANLEATGAHFVSTTEGDSGEVVLQANGTNTATINNVAINGVYAHDSTVSRGILVQAGNYESMKGAKGDNVTIENSRVDNVYGDGILLEDATNGLLTHNIASRTGECPNCKGATPVGLWTWNSTNVVMSWNESYSNTSWGGDGGGFDIDFWNTNVTAEYNYAHDNKGYCVSVFGASSAATINSIVRYNVCADNDNFTNSEQVGDFFLYTWENGTLDGTQIYNNTSYFDSTVKSAAAFEDQATFTGSNPNFFRNNLIFSARGSTMVSASSPMKLSNNLYYTPSGEALGWRWGTNRFGSLASWQSGSGQDANSLNADPLLVSPGFNGTAWPSNQYGLKPSSPAIDAGTDVCSGIRGCSMGSEDFAGNPNHAGGGYDVGAIEHQ